MFTGGYTVVGKAGAKPVLRGENTLAGRTVPAAPVPYAYPIILLNFL